MIRLLAGLAGIFIVLASTSAATGALPEKSAVQIKPQSPVAPAVKSSVSTPSTAAIPPSGVIEAVQQLPLIQEITKTVEKVNPQPVTTQPASSPLAPLLPEPPAPGPTSVNQQSLSANPAAPVPAPATQLLPADDVVMLPINRDPKGEFCLQVITAAMNLVTGDVVDFPTPCAVPPGWRIIRPCPQNLKIACAAP